MKKGISLIVLVITIIIMIILAGTIILSIKSSGIIEKASEAVFKSNLKTYNEEYMLWLIAKETDSPGEFTKELVNCSKTIDYNGQNIQDIITSMKKGDYDKYEIINGKLIYVGSSTLSINEYEKEKEWAKQTIGNQTVGSDIAIDHSTNKEVSSMVNKPLIPYSPDNSIKAISFISGGSIGQVVEDPSTNTWYDYKSDFNNNNSYYANMRTKDGSYFVWLPRYAYKIIKGYHGEGIEKAGSAYDSRPMVDVKFLKGTSNIAYDGTICSTGSDSKNEYVVHPAFTFGNRELSGIWFAKSEAGTTAIMDKNKLILNNNNEWNVKIAPGIDTWSNLTASNAFDVCRKMEEKSDYGWNTDSKNLDTHLMKNTEWSAMAMLSASNYGKTTLIPYVSMPNSYPYFSEQYSAINYSTTGNSSGIFGVGARSSELVAAHLAVYSEATYDYAKSLYDAEYKYKDVYILDKGYSYEKITFYGYYWEIYDENYNYIDSGFVEKYDEIPQQALNDGSWYDEYDYENGVVKTLEEVPNECKTGKDGSSYRMIEIPTKKYYGDALYEVENLDGSIYRAWNGNNLSMPNINSPIFVRGGYSGSYAAYYGGGSAGPFTSSISNGNYNITRTFRPVIIADPGV
ncbi:MAG: hypothetical protein PHR25_04110 [Clostridia bacterium]|nr:hypothetical protein [Clostridia bacterium]